MTRLQQIRAELSDIAKRQESVAVETLARAMGCLDEVASDDFAGRQAVKNEAKRLILVLEREAPAFARIVYGASS